jgi:IS30 family transposase
MSRSAHPQYRRLAFTPAVKQIIKSAYTANVLPRQILALIRKRCGETPLQPRDIYNAIDKDKDLELRGRSRLDSLVADLTASQWTWEMNTSPAREVSHFFS